MINKFLIFNNQTFINLSNVIDIYFIENEIRVHTVDQAFEEYYKYKVKDIDFWKDKISDFICYENPVIIHITTDNEIMRKSLIYNEKRLSATEDIPLDQLKELCDAKRLIGKTIFKLTTNSPCGYEQTSVRKVQLTKNTIKLYAKCICDDWGNAQWEFTLDDIGKTVFLTKKELENIK